MPSPLFRRARPMAVALACSTVLLSAGGLTVASGPALASAPHPAAIASDWVEQTLPTGYSIGVPLPGNPKSPVSCVSGTTFCAVIANDAPPPLDTSFDSQAVLVSSDGTTWTTTADLPTGFQYETISCPTTSTCYVAGNADSSDTDGTSVEVTTDGGETWNPISGSPGSELINTIDCPTVAICYVVAGQDGGAIIFTLNSGATWRNGFVSGDDGIWDITCTASPPPAGSCVAVGGQNNAIGQAIVLSGAGSGWTLSTASPLDEISVLASVSCVPNGASPDTCYAVGSSNDSSGSEVPVELVSTDGGFTWTANGFIATGAGWLNSVSCVDTTDCWVAGAGIQLALAGTDDGTTWFPETVSDTNQLNYVACTSVDFCVASADNALWTTTDGGGISTLPAPNPSISQPLPPITPPSVTADSGATKTVTGEDRQDKVGATVSASIRLPDGHVAKASAQVSRFFFYSLPVNSLPIGATHVLIKSDGQTVDTVTISAARSGKVSAPKFASKSRLSGSVGKSLSLTVKLTGSPHPWVWETGKLPKGVRFNPVTGVLSGTPAAGTARTYQFNFTASNGTAHDAIQQFTLIITKPAHKAG